MVILGVSGSIRARGLERGPLLGCLRLGPARTRNKVAVTRRHPSFTLDSAETLQNLAALRSNRLEFWSGDRAGQGSIRINQQWRLCFRWEDDGPCDVEVVDYH